MEDPQVAQNHPKGGTESSIPLDADVKSPEVSRTKANPADSLSSQNEDTVYVNGHPVIKTGGATAF